jgi:ABC-type transporter Mla maintaining outer membrane lipid asymmetry permease subunit MlaE
MAAAVFGPEFIWSSDKLLAALAIHLNVGAGIGMIVSYVRHLEAIDEMMRRIQLEAMAISLGVGIVGGITYSLLDTTNLIAFDAEIGHLVALFGLTYLAAILVGLKRRQ